MAIRSLHSQKPVRSAVDKKMSIIILIFDAKKTRCLIQKGFVISRCYSLNVIINNFGRLYCAWHADSKIQSSTNEVVFRYRQSNVPRLHPPSDYCRALFRCLNCAQRFHYRAHGSSRKLGGAAEAEHWTVIKLIN